MQCDEKSKAPIWLKKHAAHSVDFSVYKKPDARTNFLWHWNKRKTATFQEHWSAEFTEYFHKHLCYETSFLTNVSVIHAVIIVY